MFLAGICQRPNNSLEPPPLRFAKHPEGRGSSTGPAGPAFGFGAILAMAGRAAPPQGCSANLEAVRARSTTR